MPQRTRRQQQRLTARRDKDEQQPNLLLLPPSSTWLVEWCQLTPKRATEPLRSSQYAAIVLWSDLLCANFQYHLHWMLSLAYCSMFFNFLRVKNQAQIEVGGEDSDLTSSWNWLMVFLVFITHESRHVRYLTRIIRQSSFLFWTFCREVPCQGWVRKQSIIKQYLKDLEDCKRRWGCLLTKR